MTTREVRQDGVPQWDGKATSIAGWREKVSLYIMGTRKDDRYLCGPRLLGTLDPDSNEYKSIRKRVDDGTLSHESGSGALKVVDEIKALLGPRSLQEAVRLTLGFVSLNGVKRKPGEGMRTFIARFEGLYVEAGNALKEACGDVDPEKFLHPLVRGILLMESTNLEIVEQNSVLATSGPKGNSWLYQHLAEALQLQWSDEAVLKRDKTQRGRKAQANAVESHAWELQGIRESLEQAELEEPQYYEPTGDYETVDDEPYVEEDQSEYFDPPEELDEEVVMAADTIIEQYGGDVEDAEAYAFEQASAAARTFQEARRLLSEVRGARGYWPVVGIACAPDGSSTGEYRGRGKSGKTGRGRSKGDGRGRGKGKGGDKGRKGGDHSQFSFTPPPPSPHPAKRFQSTSGPARGGRPHGPRSPGPVCILCRQPGHIARDCPDTGSSGSQQARKRTLGSYAGAEASFVEASILAAASAEVKEDEVIEFDLEAEAHSGLSMGDLEGSAVGIWDCGATMSAGAATLLQPVFDKACSQFENVTLDQARVRFTFAGGEQSIAESVVRIPLEALDGEELHIHPVPNPNTPILLGLDNLRKLGMVLDFEADTAYSKKLGRYLPTEKLRGGHLGLKLPASVESILCVDGSKDCKKDAQAAQPSL